MTCWRQMVQACVVNPDSRLFVKDLIINRYESFIGDGRRSPHSLSGGPETTGLDHRWAAFCMFKQFELCSARWNERRRQRILPTSQDDSDRWYVGNYPSIAATAGCSLMGASTCSCSHHVGMSRGCVRDEKEVYSFDVERGCCFLSVRNEHRLIKLHMDVDIHVTFLAILHRALAGCRAGGRIGRGVALTPAISAADISRCLCESIYMSGIEFLSLKLRALWNDYCCCCCCCL